MLGRLGDLVLGDPQRQRERDEPLLGAVVQVALQPPALGQAGLDDPGARAAQAPASQALATRIARPAAAATVLRTSGSARRLRVVHDRADALALELDRRPGARRSPAAAARPAGRRA